MLEPWEKTIFNSLVLAGMILTMFTSYYYLPDYVRWFVGDLAAAGFGGDYFGAVKSTPVAGSSDL